MVLPGKSGRGAGNSQLLHSEGAKSPRVSRQNVHIKRIREVAVKQMRQHNQMCSFE